MKIHKKIIQSAEIDCVPNDDSYKSNILHISIKSFQGISNTNIMQTRQQKKKNSIVTTSHQIKLSSFQISLFLTSFQDGT